MDRPFFYSGMIWRSFDVGNLGRDAMKGISRAVESILGGQTSVAYQLSATAASPANLTVNIGQGQIWQAANVDTTTIGSLALDSTQILQGGFTTGTTLTCNVSDLTGSNQKWALVQGQFAQNDVIRTNDPSPSGIYAFYNSSNPTVPLQGQNGQGGSLPSVRLGTVNLQVVYGTIAAAGSAVPPAPTTGWVPLYLILLSSGQTQITQAQILVASPSAYTGLAYTAPFLAGLLNQHHLGIPGTAPQIDLTKEVKNVLSFPHLPVSNSSPPATGSFGGDITMGGVIGVKSYGTVNPNGNIAGSQGDGYFWTTQDLWFECTTGGSATTAVWSQVGNGGQVIYFNNFAAALVPTSGNNTYLCDTSGYASPQVNLLQASSMAATLVTLKNIGPNALTLNAHTGELIYDMTSGNLTGTLTYVLQEGQSVTLAPRSGTGYYIV